ncbi:hypothetical protein FB563_4424 [Streptomyces puniciscabiei]|uniref:Uncharacterized protein n=2 Tax=Streptomyces puniciscabiei TaxID=164348 RepID=A0A542UJV4_9ACTN|nr:hypothetical protein [Streptomyces puniciscabiei]TQK99354.1 hypothetical protein FB563_4424 [Streptomyces puniciscabiei]
MRLNLPPQAATDRNRDRYQPYLLSYVLTDESSGDSSDNSPGGSSGNSARSPGAVRTITPRDSLLPPGGPARDSNEFVIQVQPGGVLGHAPGDPAPLCRSTRGGCPPSRR